MLLLATQVFSVNGGIPAYMQRLLEIFAEYTRAPIYVTLSSGSSERPPQRLTTCRNVAASTKPGYVLASLTAALRTRPEITIAGHIGLAPVALLTKWLGLTKRYVVILHGVEAWTRRAWDERLAAKAADSIIATTTYTATVFSAENSVPCSKIQVIPLAVTGEPQLSSIERGPTQCLRLLTVGRLASSERYKGVDDIMQAMAMLSGTSNEVELDVVGQGDDRERLTRLAESLGLQERVTFHGRVSDDRLNQLYAACDVFAMPSKGEGFGIVFLEAMRHGKPCIGGNHGGTPEVIDHGINGFLVPHGDAKALVDAITTMLESPQTRIEMGRQALQTFMAKYRFSHFRRNWSPDKRIEQAASARNQVA
jgi:phosphatidyl-myo-inositol dimannoside synthase